jgi:hypothetical protein
MRCFGINCRKSSAAVAPVPIRPANRPANRSPEEVNASAAFLQWANPQDDITSFMEGYKIGKRGVTAVPIEGPAAEEERIANAIYTTHGTGHHAVSFKNGYIIGRRKFIIAARRNNQAAPQQRLNNQENNPGPPVGGSRKKTRRSKLRRSKSRRSKSRRLRD